MGLSCFEEYLLWEDRPEQPCWIIVRSRCTGVFDREKLQRAVDRTVARHPFLRSKMQNDWKGRPVWTEVPGWRCEVDWESIPELGRWPKWKALDLFKEPCFRILVKEDGGHSEIIYHFHHAVCDGKAFRDLKYDIYTFYSQEFGWEVKRPELEPGLLPQRNHLGGSWKSRFKMFPQILLGLYVTWRFQRKTVSPLQALPSGYDRMPVADTYPALKSRAIDWELYGHIRAAALKLKVSVNDLLLRDLFATVGLWRKEKGYGDPMDWVRVVLPVDMRKPSDRYLPAANVTSLVTLDRRARALLNREKMLERIHSDMAMVKHRWLRFTFWASLWISSWFPGGIRRRAKKTKCQGTIIFANHCGLVTRSPLNKRNEKMRMPGVVWDSLEMVSPLRPGTVAALVVGTYGEHFYMDLHYDPRVMREEEAGRFLEIFSEQLALYSPK